MSEGWTSGMDEMGVENFQNAAAGSKRSAKRARVLLAAKLQTPLWRGRRAPARPVAQGRLVECAQVPPVGTEVVFVRGTTVVPARVAWAGKDRLGLEFHYMIDEQEVLVHITRRPSPSPRTSAGRASRRSLSEDQRKVARAWGVAVGINLPEGKI